MALSPTETELQDDSFELEDEKLVRTHGSDEGKLLTIAKIIWWCLVLG